MAAAAAADATAQAPEAVHHQLHAPRGALGELAPKSCRAAYEAVAFSRAFHVGGRWVKEHICDVNLRIRRTDDIPAQLATPLQPTCRGSTRISAPHRDELGAAIRPSPFSTLPACHEPDVTAELSCRRTRARHLRRRTATAHCSGAGCALEDIGLTHDAGMCAQRATRLSSWASAYEVDIYSAVTFIADERQLFVLAVDILEVDANDNPVTRQAALRCQREQQTWPLERQWRQRQRRLFASSTPRRSRPALAAAEREARQLAALWLGAS